MISIAIPCYEMGGRGSEFLEYNFIQINKQTYTDFEVVITDHSVDDELKKLCNAWDGQFKINYTRISENRGSASYNTNQAIRNSQGSIIKILYQDDYLYDEHALQLTVDNFHDRYEWLISDYIHTRDRKEYYRPFKPFLHERIHLKNLIGAPSCLTLRNRNVLYFDENLRWAFDCEYYKRLYLNFGMPAYLSTFTTVNVIWDGQLTHEFKELDTRKKEKEYVANLYGDTVREDEWD
jgi:glycosyltransferase involved in cell wall biosynthesis